MEKTKVSGNMKSHAYHISIRKYLDAAYDIVTASEIEDTSKIICNPILFIESVYNDAVMNGRWVKISKAP